MNCFNNNRPKLSASERTKNIKSKTIFKSNVLDYQTKVPLYKKCNNFNGNVGFIAMEL